MLIQTLLCQRCSQLLRVYRSHYRYDDQRLLLVVQKIKDVQLYKFDDFNLVEEGIGFQEFDELRCKKFSEEDCFVFFILVIRRNMPKLTRSNGTVCFH